MTRLHPTFVLLAAGAAALLPGCAPAGTPWRSTRLVPPAAGVPLDPPPPPELFWLRVLSAEIPAKTAGGTAWDDNGAPNPIFVLLADGREVMRAEPEPDTLAPSWPDGPRGNLERGARQSLRLDLFDADPIGAQPIGSATFDPPGKAELEEGEIELDIGRHGKVRIRVERAHALVGLGFECERQGEHVRVTRVLRFSAAGRAGMRRGDRIMTVGGARAGELAPAELDRRLGAVPAAGLALVVEHDGGANESMMLVEGPAYPLLTEYGSVE